MTQGLAPLAVLLGAVLHKGAEVREVLIRVGRPDLRPVPGSTSDEGPVERRYLLESDAWSGGSVMGALGPDVTQEVIAGIRAGRA